MPDLHLTINDAAGNAAWPAGMFAPGPIAFRGARTTVLLGPSGCGKTTILRTLAGLIAPDGWATLGVAPDTQRIALLPQDAGLLPWFTARQNVSIGARLRNEVLDTRRADDLLAHVGLSDFVAAKPAELSGGMRQRVALARALYEEADVLLLDEPFSSLDAIARRDMQDLTLSLTAERTVVLVTHDPDEALRMADDVIVLHGRPVRAHPFAETPDRDVLWKTVMQSATQTVSHAGTGADA